MHVESSRLARIRAFEVTPQLFRRVAVATLVAIIVVVTTGAVVRLTASGLGCDNWPRCGDTPFPEKGQHAFIEFGNRVVALLTIVCTLGAWLASRRVVGLPRFASGVALAMFVGSVAQIPLGGLTVIFDLNPLLVMSHLLLAILVLGCAVVLAVEANRLVVGAAEVDPPLWLRRVGLVLVFSCFVLVVTGAFATAAGPHPGGQHVRRLGEAYRSVVVHAATTAVFGCSFLLMLGYLERRRQRWPALADAAVVVLALLVVQVAVGETQYHTDLPWWLVLVHVSLAATVWVATVGLVALVWRPPAALVRAARIH